jgi:hypothetical protein
VKRAAPNPPQWLSSMQIEKKKNDGISLEKQGRRRFASATPEVDK